MSAASYIETFVPLGVAATRLGVPKAWLKTEASAGRVPVLRAGRRMLLDVDAVRRALTERAACAIQREVAHAH